MSSFTITATLIPRRTAVAVVLTLLSLACGAQTLAVSTGVPKGTYASMFRDIHAVCGSRLPTPLIEKPSSGSAESLERLLNNEVSVAFVQADVLYHRAQVDDVGRIKALMPLHAEPVHVIVRASAGAGSSLWAMLPQALQRTAPTSVGELGGKRVGAWGGGMVTAQQIRLQGQIPYEVVDVGGPGEAIKALESGTVDAVMAVGGAPLDWVRGLDTRFRLLRMGEDTVSRLRHIYSPAKLNYANLGASGVATVSTHALMAVRDVRTPQALAPLQALRQCVVQQLGRLRETVGHHRAWDAVDPDADPRWPVLGRP